MYQTIKFLSGSDIILATNCNSAKCSSNQNVLERSLKEHAIYFSRIYLIRVMLISHHTNIITVNLQKLITTYIYQIMIYKYL